jgi:2-oxoglutarate dehydrogenase E2 component (dihydrolipoamide succinyltransferase)
MAGEIIVPTLGESVSEATVAKWFKQPGDAVKADEPLVELETDKVTVEVNAPAAGVLKEQTVKTGASVEVGALLGKIEVGAAGGKVAAAPAPAAAAKPEPVKAAPAPVAAANAAPSTASNGPAVAKLAAENPQVNVAAIAGSGKDGRVMKESQNTAAILTTFNEIDMLQRCRNCAPATRMKFLKEHGVKLGFMSFFVKAATQALKQFPVVNASVDGRDILYTITTTSASRSARSAAWWCPSCATPIP